MQPDIRAQQIMRSFGAATGLLNTQSKPRRYLWTDAFAVCNYLHFYRQSGEQPFLQEALQLVDQVHQVLGRHRNGGPEGAWISGLSEEQAQLHPTLGGLRIGKPLDERHAEEPINESLEWQQDGQYFHYLTKWMHALNCVSRDTGDGIYNQWALELAKTAHAAFTYSPAEGGPKRIYWKMSIDLTRPLVASMGKHDALDGLITYQQLQAGLQRFPETPPELSLTTEIEEFKAICDEQHWVTDDALGIGGLLTDAYKLVQLIDAPWTETWQLDSDATARLEVILHAIEYSLHAFFQQDPFKLAAEHRLAFRELGLAIGLQAISRMQQLIERHPARFSHLNIVADRLANLVAFHHAHEAIENFWLAPEHQSVDSWQDHADINNVMLATSLQPDGYLQL